jgi:hypothetical protein
VSVSEGNAGTTDAVFTVSLSAPYDQDVTVEYLTSDPTDFDGWWATAGSDYAVTSGTLRIPAGQTSGMVRVPVIGDTLDEEDEFFALGLDNPSDNARIGGVTTYGMGEIRDDDGPAKTWVGPATGGNWSAAANWSPGGVPTAYDAVLISGNSVNLSASATVTSLNLIGGATLTLAANGSRVLRTSSLSISPNSKLNLNDNDLIIDYAAAGVSVATPMNEVVSKLATGRQAAPSGVYSASANASSGLHALGVAEANDVLGITGGQTAAFSGQTVDATCVLVKFTYGGDANLDGSVGFADLVRVAQNYNSATGGTWAGGDFTHDGRVDFADLVVLAQNYGGGVAATSATSVAAPAQGSDATEILVDRRRLDDRPFRHVPAVRKPAPVAKAKRPSR